MKQPFSRTPVADQTFEDRWSAFGARGAATDRAAYRKFLVITVLLATAVGALNILWFLRS